MNKPYQVSLWCLYDADADQKYFKKCGRDGSLAIFDTEAEAVSAKCLRDGHMRVDYVKLADFEAALTRLAETDDLAQQYAIRSGEAMAQRDKLATLLRDLREITGEYAWDESLETRIDAALAAPSPQ